MQLDHTKCDCIKCDHIKHNHINCDHKNVLSTSCSYAAKVHRLVDPKTERT